MKKIINSLLFLLVLLNISLLFMNNTYAWFKTVGKKDQIIVSVDNIGVEVLSPVMTTFEKGESSEYKNFNYISPLNPWHDVPLNPNYILDSYGTTRVVYKISFQKVDENDTNIYILGMGLQNPTKTNYTNFSVTTVVDFKINPQSECETNACMYFKNNSGRYKTVNYDQIIQQSNQYTDPNMSSFNEYFWLYFNVPTQENRFMEILENQSSTDIYVIMSGKNKNDHLYQDFNFFTSVKKK